MPYRRLTQLLDYDQAHKTRVCPVQGWEDVSGVQWGINLKVSDFEVFFPVL